MLSWLCNKNEFENIRKLPWAMTFIFNLTTSLLIYDLSFYLIHISFHKFKYFMKFHNQHHEYKMPKIFCTEYSDSIEQILLNDITPFIGNV